MAQAPSVTEAATSDIDLFSDEVLTDRDPYFTQLRELATVVYLPANKAYAITRYDAIRDALATPAVFSSAKVAFNDDMNNALRGTTLATDPPEHTALRAALTENLSPKALRPVKADIDTKAERMVAELVARGTFDGAADLAKAFPLSVVADMIGVTGSARENILRWGEAAFNVLGPMNPRTIESFPIAGELFGWATTVSADDLTQGSIGRAIFAAAERGDIPADACGHIIHQYVAAGMDTTIASIGNAINYLGQHPDQWAILREDPTLVSAAFMEALRMEAPAHAFGRLVLSDVEIDGTLVPAGSQVALLFGAGNHDPRHYERPDEFLVRRNPTDHLSFGYGVHACAGQGLAKLEAHAVLTAMVSQIKSFEVGPGYRKLRNMTRSLDTLPVTVTARA